MSSAVLLLAMLLAAGAPDPAAVSPAVSPAVMQAGGLTVSEGEEASFSVWNREVARFRATYKDATPERRARMAHHRLRALEEFGDWEVLAQPTTIGELEGYTIVVDGQSIFGLVAEDLDPIESPSLEAVANTAAARLQQVLEARRDARRIPVLLRGIGLAIAATALYGLLLRLLGRTVQFIVSRVGSAVPRLPKTWRIWNFDASENLEELRLFFVRILSLALGLGLTYLWVTFVLSQFPYTQPWSQELGGYLLEALDTLADGALASIPNLFVVFIIFAVTRIFVRLVGAFFVSVERGRAKVTWLEPATAKATKRIVGLVLWLFAVTVAYPYLPGSGTDAFKGISVFVGLMVTVGSTGLVNQVMSGLVVLYSRALKAGEYVQVGEDEGVVIGVGFLSTRIATPKQEEIIIPNAVLTGKVLRNLSHLKPGDGATACTTVTIGYDAPWRQVEALLCGAASKVDAVREDPPPRVVQKGLSDFYVEYELIFHLKRPNRRVEALSDTHRQIQDAFNEAGIQIMSPHFRLQPEEPVVIPPAQWEAHDDSTHESNP